MTVSREKFITIKKTSLKKSIFKKLIIYSEIILSRLASIKFIIS